MKRIAADLGPPADDMQRRYVLSTATLASSHLAGPGRDVDRACAVMSAAIPGMAALTSVRARHRVDVLRSRLAGHADRPSVQQWEHRYEQAAFATASP